MPEDRDQLFERALARRLRADGAGNASVCLDPETLAAYHERLLSAEEMAAAKQHLLGCARCQEILAQLELTHDLVEKEEQQAVPANAATPAFAAAKSQARVTEFPAKKRTTLRWAAPLGAIAAVLLLWIGLRQPRLEEKATTAPVQIADNRDQNGLHSQAKAAAEPAAPSTEERQKVARESGTDDLRPLGLPHSSLKHEPQNAAVAQPAAHARADSLPAGEGSGAGNGPALKSKQAKQAPVAAPTLDAADSGKDVAVLGGASGAMLARKSTAPSPVPPAANNKAEMKSRQDPGNPAYSAGRPAAAAGASMAAVPPPPPPPAMARASTRASGQLRGTVTDPSGAVVSGANVALKSANGSTVTQTSTDGTGTYTFDGVVAGNYQLELQSPGFKTGAINGLNITGGDNVQNAQLQIGTSSETVEVAAQAAGLNAQAAEVSSVPLRDRNIQALVFASSGLQTVTSPNGKAVWKFGDAGQIIYSKNAGKEWISQPSAVSAKLLAASAPSAKICWIAGAAGTLLRTTDGGKHWQLIITPIAGDLGGVLASDGKHASIWDPARRESFQTSNGGKTWEKKTAN